MFENTQYGQCDDMQINKIVELTSQERVNFANS